MAWFTTVMRAITLGILLVVGAGQLAAQTPMPAGKILLTNLTGKATIVTDGAATLATEGQSLLPGATVKTDASSSAIIAFSNGIVVSVSGNSEFGIGSFTQDPFDKPINLASLASEPTMSRTSLRLLSGDVIVRVKHLRHEIGSQFTLSCPGGTVGVRGTVFRMSARAAGKGKEDVVIDVIEGRVSFSPNGQPNVEIANGHKYSGTLPTSP